MHACIRNAKWNETSRKRMITRHEAVDIDEREKVRQECMGNSRRGQHSRRVLPKDDHSSTRSKGLGDRLEGNVSWFSNFAKACLAMKGSQKDKELG